MGNTESVITLLTQISDALGLKTSNADRDNSKPLAIIDELIPGGPAYNPARASCQQIRIMLHEPSKTNGMSAEHAGIFLLNALNALSMEYAGALRIDGTPKRTPSGSFNITVSIEESGADIAILALKTLRGVLLPYENLEQIDLFKQLLTKATSFENSFSSRFDSTKIVPGLFFEDGIAYAQVNLVTTNNLLSEGFKNDKHISRTFSTKATVIKTHTTAGIRALCNVTPGALRREEFERSALAG